MLLDNLVISVKAVAPMFIVMAVGVLIRRKGIINEEEVKKVNRMIFVALFPALMFSNLYGKELSDAFNPRLAAFAVIMLAVAFNIRLPHFAENTVGMLADAATPMALLILGASFDIKSVEKVKRNLIICTTGRLIVVPLIALTCGVLAGFRDVALVTLVAIFAAPTAVSSFTMAQQMDSDGELAGACVIFSSMFSCLTMFCWIFILKSLGLF